MGVNIANTVLTGPSGNSVSVADSSGNILYKQDSSGYVHGIQTSGGSALTPMFNVGAPNTGWTSLTSGAWNTIPFNYTSGSGYKNVNSCYNTSTYRFTAPWDGIYMFKAHAYIYGADGSVYNKYLHPQFAVNGGMSTRRPYGTPYRMRQYGIPSSYGHDTDCCELIRLYAGDYVDVRFYPSGTMQYYSPYCAWSGSYVGSY